MILLVDNAAASVKRERAERESESEMQREEVSETEGASAPVITTAV